MGVTAASRYGLSVEPNGTSTLTFVIAGSAKDRKAAVDTYHYLAANQASLLEEKKAHYTSLIDRARVRIPDQRLQEVYNWVRIDAEWLAREVPGMGRGLGAGLMEYPWWFGTETYSLQALMASGNCDLAKQTLRLLNEQSIKANGNPPVTGRSTGLALRSRKITPLPFSTRRGTPPRLDRRSGVCRRDVPGNEAGHPLAAH